MRWTNRTSYFQLFASLDYWSYRTLATELLFMFSRHISNAAIADTKLFVAVFAHCSLQPLRNLTPTSCTVPVNHAPNNASPIFPYLLHWAGAICMESHPWTSLEALLLLLKFLLKFPFSKTTRTYSSWSLRAFTEAIPYLSAFPTTQSYMANFVWTSRLSYKVLTET